MPVGHGKKSGFTFFVEKKAILGRKKPFLGHIVSLKIFVQFSCFVPGKKYLK